MLDRETSNSSLKLWSCLPFEIIFPRELSAVFKVSKPWNNGNLTLCGLYCCSVALLLVIIEFHCCVLETVPLVMILDSTDS